MKIEYIKGDLFTTDHTVIAHGCNDKGVQGSGVAKIVRERFPNSYKKYNKYCESHGEVGGEVVFVKENNKVIANAITQHGFGGDGKRYVNYEWVAQCMQKINGMCEFYDVKHVAMPMIGCGLGGGNADVIKAIIESEATNFTPVVYIL